jgi:hypothetical protein
VPWSKLGRLSPPFPSDALPRGILISENTSMSCNQLGKSLIAGSSISSPDQELIKKMRLNFLFDGRHVELMQTMDEREKRYIVTGS